MLHLAKLWAAYAIHRGLYSASPIRYTSEIQFSRHIEHRKSSNGRLPEAETGMGLGYTGMQAFALLTRFAPSLDRVVTIGRQHHYSVYADMMELSDQFGLNLTAEKVGAALANSGFADELLKAFGCAEVQSLDVSDYEGASIIADLNEPISSELVEQYSLVIESGTFEHVFNQRTAFENIFKMIKPGGHLLFVTPCSGFCGHGFFQLSPELLFSLCAANDFAVELAYVVPGNVKSDKIFLCPTPASIRARVEISWSGPIYFVLIARKTHAIEHLEQPYQWDYEHVFWQGKSVSSGTLLIDDIFAGLGADGAATGNSASDAKSPASDPLRITAARSIVARVLHGVGAFVEPKKLEPTPAANVDAAKWFYSVQPFRAVVPQHIRGAKQLNAPAKSQP